MNTIENIKAELSKVANTLGNAGNGQQEKTIQVTFGKEPNAIRIDGSKFVDSQGNLLENPNAISEEKGRLLTKSELSKSIACLEPNDASNLRCSSKQVKNLFTTSTLKNSIQQVKSEWQGFASDIDAFAGSIPVSNHPANSVEKLAEDWLFNKPVPAMAKSILDELAETLKDSPNKIQITKNYLEKLKELIETSDSDDSDDSDSDDSDSDDSDSDDSDSDDSDSDDSDSDDSDSDDSD